MPLRQCRHVKTYKLAKTFSLHNKSSNSNAKKDGNIKKETERERVSSAQYAKHISLRNIQYCVRHNSKFRIPIGR